MARENYTKLYALEFSLVQIPDYDNYFVKVSGKRCFGIKKQTKDKIYTIEFLFWYQRLFVRVLNTEDNFKDNFQRNLYVESSFHKFKAIPKIFEKMKDKYQFWSIP